MTYETLNESINEAKRFLKAAEAAKKRIKGDMYWAMGCRETAACRRASMDLTRSLAELRKVNQ